MLRRAVILSVTVEGLSQAETARRYTVSKAFVSQLLARYRVEGDAAFEARSQRPKSSPTALTDDIVGLIIGLRDELVFEGLDAGPDTLAWHLQHHHGRKVSAATIRRKLVAAKRITPEPRKRPRSSYIRFEAALPNETWQSDFTHWRLADGSDSEIITWLDDHSRAALSVTAHACITGDIVLATFTETAENTGYPASVLTDNGMVYTARFAYGRGGRNQLETLLGVLGIDQKHSRPNHPTTCGKVERFQQTMKKWLRAQPAAESIAELQERIDSSSSPTTSTDRTARSANEPPPSSTTCCPKPHPETPAPASTSASAPTPSTTTAKSASAAPARCTTSASVAPTKANQSYSSSPISTSASCTATPANSSPKPPSTQPAATNHNPENETARTQLRVRAFAMSCNITARRGGDLNPRTRFPRSTH
jgi:transposase InsO family protein